MDLLPGAGLVLFGLLLGGSLRRWFDPLPASVWAFFAALLAVLYGPVLVGGEVLLPLDSLRGETPFRQLAPTDPHGNLLQGDLVQLVAPSRELVRQAWAAGRWPLWNPWVGAGMPLLADPQAQVLQPLAVLALPLPVTAAAGLTAAARVLLALVFTWLLLARQGLGRGPATAGAVAYGLGSFIQLWLGWPLANTAAWLPVVLYGILRLEAGGRRDRVLLTAAGIGLLLSGHPETVLYACGLALAFFLARWRGAACRRDLALGFAGSWAVAAALAAPVLVPTARYLPESLRSEMLRAAAGPVSVADAAPLSEPTAEPLDEAVAPQGYSWRRTFLPLVAPNTFGNSRYAVYWGRSNSNEDASAFPGTVTLLAALLAVLLAVPGMSRLLGGPASYPQERLMLAALLVALGILALPPPWLRPLAAVPALGAPALDGYHRLLLVVNFALAYLAACTLARWQDGWEGQDGATRSNLKMSRGVSVGVLVLVLVLVALGLGAVIAWAYLGNANPRDPAALEVLRIGWLHWQGRFLALGVLVLGMAALGAKGLGPRWLGLGRLRRWLPAAAALLIAAELVLLHRDVNPPMPSRLAFPPSPPLAFLERLVEPDGPRMAALGGALPPNLGVLYGLADARVYNPVEPADYAGFTGALIEPPRRNVPRYGDPQSPLWDRLGVEYLLVDAGIELAPPLERVLEDPAGWVYRRPQPLPLAYWVPASGEPLPHMPRKAELDLVEPERWSLRPSTANAQRPLDGGELELRTALYRHSGGPFGGGWRVLAHGEQLRPELLPTQRAGGPFLAVPWPPGPGTEDRRAELLYRPPGFLLGCLLAGLGVTAAALFLCPLPSGLRPRSRSPALSSSLSPLAASPSQEEE